MSRVATPASRVRRAPLLVFVVVVLVAAVAFAATAGGATSRVETAGAGTRAGAVTMPPHGSRSSAWYCAAGTANKGGNADETVLVANVGDRDARADVEVVTGGPQPAAVRHLTVPARSRVAAKVGAILPTPSPGVIVETFGANLVVEHELRNGSQGAAGPCARRPSSTWYIPAGTTAKDAQQWLSLFDPFGDDAIVDVTFLTDTGTENPQALQGLVVSRHSKLLVSVHDQIRRRNVVATQIVARTGRVVAEQELIFDGSAGRSGLTLSLGTPSTATSWTLPAGSFVRGRDALYLMNPGTTAVSVDVDVVLDGEARLTPSNVTVPDHSVATVDLLSRVPAGTSFWVRVHGDRPFAAQQLTSQTLTAGRVTTGRGGSAAVMPSAVTASRWVFALARTTPTSLDTIVAANPSGRPVRLRIQSFATGGSASVTGPDAVTIPPGARVVVDVRARKVATGAAVVATSDGPLVVERVDVAGPTLIATLGVPDLG